MRLAFYECTKPGCKARFLGRDGQPCEHCGVEATRLHAANERCDGKQIVKLGTGRDLRKGRVSKKVTRGFWKQTPGEPITEAEANKPRDTFDESMVVHTHRCVLKDGHTGPCQCTCDYEWGT